jgi:hypothetical protein
MTAPTIMWRPPLPTTVEEFERWYADNGGVTVEFLHDHGRFGAPCDCGDEICTGFQMMYRDDLIDDLMFSLRHLGDTDPLVPPTVRNR